MSSSALPDPEKLLLDMSKGEKLEPKQIEQITELLGAVNAQTVGRRVSVDDVYSYLVVLQKGQLKEFRHLVERFLEIEDSLTAALALETLCLDWGFTEDYLERVLSFALGVPWDFDQDVQQAAIKVIGEYLRGVLGDDVRGAKLSPAQEHVLSLLLSIFESEEFEHWTRQAAYFALLRAWGKEWEEFPAECVQIDFAEGSEDIDAEMIEVLRELVGADVGEGDTPIRVLRGEGHAEKKSK